MHEKNCHWYTASEDLAHSDPFEDSLSQESEIYGLWAKAGPSHIFVNNVLLEHSSTRLLIIYGPFCYNGRPE